jgi:hypothetical protein
MFSFDERIDDNSLSWFYCKSSSGLAPKTIMISLLDISQPVSQNLNLKYWDIFN